MHLGITGEELKHCKKNNYNIRDALILPAKLGIIARKAETKSIIINNAGIIGANLSKICLVSYNSYAYA